MKIEICVDSAEGAAAAVAGGADRVELCDNLFEGGTTPSAGMIRAARARARGGLMVLIRPRGGDFLYSETEFEVMLEDIRVAKDLVVDGVVVGCLRSDGRIDSDGAARLIAAARPLAVTFHRAFDMACDPFEALEELVLLGVDRILTSGQEASALEGLELIGELHRRAAGRVIILPGGGITAGNVRRIVEGTGAEEVHLSARTSTESGMRFRNSRAFMGGVLRPPEYSRKVTDPAAVRAVADALRPTR